MDFSQSSSLSFTNLFILSLFFIGVLSIFSIVSSVWKHIQIRRKLAHLPGNTQLLSLLFATLLPVPDSFKKNVLGLSFYRPNSFTWDDLIQEGAKYGRIFKRVFGSQAIVVVADPDMNELLIKKSYKLLEKVTSPPFANFPHVAGAHSVFSAPHSLWKNQRTVLNAAFTDQAMEEVAQFASLSVQRSIKYLNIEKPSVVNTDELMARITCDVICKVGFGQDVNSAEFGLQGDAAKIVGSSDLVQKYSVMYGFIPSFWRRLHTDRVLANAQATFSAIVDKAIAARAKEQNDPESTGSEGHKDILTMILRSSVQNHHGESNELTMSRKELISNTIAFLIAGHDTTAGTLRYALYHLAKDPQRQEKLYKEVMCILGSDSNSEITMDLVNRLNEPESYVKAVVQETQRLTPVAPITSRTTMEDIDFKGYLIPKGVEVQFDMRAVMCDPAIWGTDSHQFNPERMLGYDTAKNAHIFTPFGMGQRICIGKRFAMTEALVVLSLLVRAYRFEPVTQELHIEAQLTSKNVTPVLVRFIPRN